MPHVLECLIVISLVRGSDTAHKVAHRRVDLVTDSPIRESEASLIADIKVWRLCKLGNDLDPLNLSPLLLIKLPLVVVARIIGGRTILVGVHLPFAPCFVHP